MQQPRKTQDEFKAHILEERKEVMAKSTKKGAYGTKKKGCSSVMAGKAPTTKKPSGLKAK